MGKRFKPEEIVMKLREVEIQQGRGMDTAEACRQVGITEATYYRWRREYGGDLPHLVVPMFVRERFLV